MKRYAQFYEKRSIVWNAKTRSWIDVDPYYAECMGSDGILILDGRKNIQSCIQDCMDTINRRKKLNPDISGFKIMAGDLHCAQCVHKSFKEEK